ncbi:MAG TPA: hypothetical protein V6C82_10840 [Chroococcales cyanobacterium]
MRKRCSLRALIAIWWSSSVNSDIPRILRMSCNWLKRARMLRTSLAMA